jgi:hypothetical protein
MALQLPVPPEPDALAEAVSPALADYRIWRDGIDVLDAFRPPVPTVRTAFTRWVIPRESDLSRQGTLANALLQGGRWHLQIHLGDRPRYYARVRHPGAEEGLEEKWIVEWFGEKYVEPVERGIEYFTSRPELEGELRLVSSDFHQFTSFWLHPATQFYVVSASPALKDLPRFELIPEETLRRVLADRVAKPRRQGRGR